MHAFTATLYDIFTWSRGGLQNKDDDPSTTSRHYSNHLKQLNGGGRSTEVLFSSQGLQTWTHAGCS
jgi:hypothetical protein